MNGRWKALASALLLLAAWPANAETLEIRADGMTLTHEKREVTFTGSVYLKRDDFVLHCDRLIAYYKEKDNELERAHAYGHVRMEQGTTKGSSDEAKLDYVHQVLTLIGHAVVYQPKGRLEGQTIVHDIRKERTVVQSPGEGKARLIIESDESGKAVIPVPELGHSK